MTGLTFYIAFTNLFCWFLLYALYLVPSICTSLHEDRAA